MATLAALKKKLANLEAQVEKVTKAEMGSAIAKVRKIMADFGLTVEHLTASVTSKAVATKSKSPKAPAKSKGSKPAKYRDPSTGVTWAGVGRAPAWIASAKNRDEFLIAKPAAAEATAKAPAPAKKATKRVAPVKRAKAVAVAKKAALKVAASAKRVAKAAAPAPAPATKKVAVKKGVANQAASKKAASKKVVAKAMRKTAPSKSIAALTESGGASAEASSS